MFSKNVVSVLLFVGYDMQKHRITEYIIFGNYTWTWNSIVESKETEATQKILMSRACLCCQRRKCIVIVY
jgi:hypothetical protein